MEKPVFTLSHVGINAADEKEALEIVSLFAGIFDLELRTGGKGSPFAGTYIEGMRGNGPGEKGHIAFYTPDMEAAIDYLENKGVEINYASAKRREGDNSIYVIYLAREIAGFAIQLINK